MNLCTKRGFVITGSNLTNSILISHSEHSFFSEAILILIITYIY